MASLPTSDRWWPRFVVLVLVATLIGPGASLVFDRNGDGIDDGGLALCLPETFEAPRVAAVALLKVTLSGPRPALVSGLCVNPRSPPSSSSDSR